ncbi:MAG: FAD-binding oxidoreductase [Spirochaetales bacterium]|nr:FAD-binding oxidoreductase [Spirochaetales bacterium]
MAYSIIPCSAVADEYLRDESRFTGAAETFSFPETEPDVVFIVKKMAAKNIPITTQGARTGITGGAVPLGGHAINMARMKKIIKIETVPGKDEFIITVEPGMTLAEFRELLKTDGFPVEAAGNDRDAKSFISHSHAYFFPPELTETSATLGGMASCNASGARSFLYGPVRPWITGMRVVLANGEILDLSRTRRCIQGRRFEIISPGEVSYSGEIPSYPWRDVKNAAGYYSKPEMDLLDLFIGQEGTLGIITAMSLIVIKKPEHSWGVLFAFGSFRNALRFVDHIQKNRGNLPLVSVASLEFFDRHAIDFAQTIEQGHLPLDTSSWEAAVYVEFVGNDEDKLETALSECGDFVEKLGEDPDKSVSAALPHELEKISNFRHAVPEAINLKVANIRQSNSTITKLSTDFAVPDGRLTVLVDVYDRILGPAGLFFAMFGHVGDNHLHVNIIPETTEAFEKGKELYLEIAKEVISLGGTISAEHGVGKIKRDFLKLMFGDDGIAEMKRIKRIFDPGFLLNRGNLFLP